MTTQHKRPIWSCALLAASAAIAAATLGCPASEPARLPEPQPLVIGTSPPVAPIAVAPRVQQPPAIEEARGGAPRVFVRSLTTPGNVVLPAGKVVIVHFWATWCGPCKRSFPELQELHTRLRARGLEVIALSVDDESSGVAEFAKAQGATFPVGWDDGHRLAQAYAVDTMPTTYVIDRSGNIAKTFAAYHDGQAREIERALVPLL